MRQTRVVLTVNNNVLLYRVVEQDIDLPQVLRFKASNDIQILSSAYPELQWKHKRIYLRGIDAERDNNLSAHTFKSNKEACEAARQIKQAFKELNTFIQKEQKEKLIDYQVIYNGPYVAFWIKDQVHLPEGYSFEPWNPDAHMNIRVLLHPGISESTIYLRGVDKSHDCRIASYMCKDNEAAKRMAQKIHKSINYWLENANDLPIYKVSVEIEGDFK